MFCKWFRSCDADDMCNLVRDSMPPDEGLRLRLLFVLAVQCIIPIISAGLFLKYGYQRSTRRILLSRVVLSALVYQLKRLHRFSMAINTTSTDETTKEKSFDEVEISIGAKNCNLLRQELFIFKNESLGPTLWSNPELAESTTIEKSLRTSAYVDGHALETVTQFPVNSLAKQANEQTPISSALRSTNDRVIDIETPIPQGDIIAEQKVITREDIRPVKKPLEMAPNASVTSTRASTETESSHVGDPGGTGDPTTFDLTTAHNPGSLKAKTAMARSKRRLRNKFDMITINADADFTFEEMDIIDRFMQTLHRFLAEFGLNLPRLSSELVSVQPQGKNHSLPETYICIIGFTTMDAIKKFDAKLSKTENRSLYHPLKLCYLLDRINYSATSETYIIEASQNVTFCGTLMMSQLECSCPFVSTIGGLITVKNKSYALTTNHLPEETRDEKEQLLESSLDSHQKQRLLLNSKDVIDCGDWRLVQIQPDHQRPNVILEDFSESTTGTRMPIYVEDSYRIKSRVFSDSRDILIASGRSGLKKGTLSKRRTFILSKSQQLQEVWVINLDFQDFQSGDSGSWVIHQSSQSLLGVLVARSSNSGYMVPFTRVQEDISAIFKVPSQGIRPCQSRPHTLGHERPKVAAQITQALQGLLWVYPSFKTYRIPVQIMMDWIPLHLLVRSSFLSRFRSGNIGLLPRLPRGRSSTLKFIWTMDLKEWNPPQLLLLLWLSTIPIWGLVTSVYGTNKFFTGLGCDECSQTYRIYFWSFALLWSAYLLGAAETNGRWFSLTLAWVKLLLLTSIVVYAPLLQPYTSTDHPSFLMAWRDRQWLPCVASAVFVTAVFAFVMVPAWIQRKLCNVFHPLSPHSFPRKHYVLGSSPELQHLETGPFRSTPRRVRVRIHRSRGLRRSTTYIFFLCISTVLLISIAASLDLWGWINALCWRMFLNALSIVPVVLGLTPFLITIYTLAQQKAHHALDAEVDRDY